MNTQIRDFSLKQFLLDVLICSMGAFGGPQSHISIFIDQLSRRRGYVTIEEILRYNALATMLPGPSSTQTLIAIARKTGGNSLAVAALAVWALPIMTVLAIISLLWTGAEGAEHFSRATRLLGPMAVGFIVLAAFRIGKKVVIDVPTALLLAASAVISFFIQRGWVFPALLVIGGIIAVPLYMKPENIGKVSDGEHSAKPQGRLRFGWIAPLSLIIIGSALSIAAGWKFGIRAQGSHQPLQLAIQIVEAMYRYGYLVYGGGQVVIPMMFTELVDVRHVLSAEEFLAGYGLVQGLPGPMFSFATFTAGLAGRDMMLLPRLMLALGAGAAIFVPGTVLLLWIFPMWERLSENRWFSTGLIGVYAVAGGFLVSAAPRIFLAAGVSVTNVIAAAATVVLLGPLKIPAPLVVVATLIAGYILPL